MAIGSKPHLSLMSPPNHLMGDLVTSFNLPLVFNPSAEQLIVFPPLGGILKKNTINRPALAKLMQKSLHRAVF